MNLEYLRNYMIVVDTKSFSKAAELIHISQPALTKQIQGIEKEFNCQLFSRSSKGLELTNQGTLFLKYAQNILESVELFKQELEVEKEKDFKSIRIGYTTEFHQQLIKKALGEVTNNNPDIDVTITKKMPYELIDMLRNDEIDCAFMHLPSVQGEIGIDYKTLIQSGMSVRLNKDDPNAMKKDISLRDLLDYTLVIEENSCPKFKNLYMNQFHQIGRLPKIKKVKDKTNVKLLAGIGDYMIITTQYSIEIENTKKVPIQELREGADIILAFKENTTNINVNKLIDALLKIL